MALEGERYTMIKVILIELLCSYFFAMKRLLFAFMVLIISCDSPTNQEAVNYEGETILVGDIDWQGLTSAQYGTWFIKGYKEYVVDSVALQPLVGSLSGVNIIVFVGTWCDDSKYQLPQFYKILDYLKYDLNDLRVIGLERLEDSQLVGPNQQAPAYDIGFVPTYIFYQESSELGRITEFPQQSLEKDMIKIVQTK